MIVQGFPTSPALVRGALDNLDRAVDGTAAERKKLGPVTKLPRPWDPPTCAGSLRRDLWRWLEEVIGWINHEYARLPEQLIPPCWPQHPAVAHEIAVVAVLRHYAGRDPMPTRLEEWHRITLPDFFQRLFVPGVAFCESGRHREWSGTMRHRDYASTDSTKRRVTMFDDDVASADPSV